MDDSFNESIMRKLFDYDRICFKKCINIPEKKFSSNEEFCLSE